MSNPSGPVTAQSIAGQMGGLGSGSSAAPVTGFPAPDMSFAPPQDSSGSTYYSSTNPFSVPSTDASGVGGGGDPMILSGGPAMARRLLPDVNAGQGGGQYGAFTS